MFDIIKKVIAAGGYKLADIQYRIKKLYAMGDLTETEADQLLVLAQGGVSPEAERPETLALIQTLSDKITALDARVKALEGGGEDPEDPSEYPAWKPWDGISTDYQPGAIVSHNGELWESVYDGQNVWEPGAVDNRFWVVYTPDEGV